MDVREARVMQVCQLVLQNIFKKIITEKKYYGKNVIVSPLTNTYVHLYMNHVSGHFAFLKSVWRATREIQMSNINFNFLDTKFTAYRYNLSYCKF